MSISRPKLLDTARVNVVPTLAPNSIVDTTAALYVPEEAEYSRAGELLSSISVQPETVVVDVVDLAARFAAVFRG